MGVPPPARDRRFGLVIDWEFHQKRKWVCAQTPYLVEAIIREFGPTVITSQREYERKKHEVEYVIAFEPRWAAPVIEYDRRARHQVGVFVSDPHSKTDWFDTYVERNRIQWVFSYYYHPFLHHFPNFDLDRLVHIPWAVPDAFVSRPEDVQFRGQRTLNIFGAARSDAYDCRQWCREFDFVTNHTNSGVENKVLNDAEYFEWTKQFDAIVAAGSLSPSYQLVTPKYFEAAAAGTLLFAQYCRDLELLGFNDANCIVFDKQDFAAKAERYLRDPESELPRRRRGVELIRERHTISQRIKHMRSLMPGERPS